MATAMPVRKISEEEYIARFVEGNEKPACEYVDGELIRKAMGTKKHGQVQMNLGRLIFNLYGDVFNPLPELSARLRIGKFYIPDVAIEELANPIEGEYPGPGNPVFLCVEILLPGDRLGKLFTKCEEYHKWGVPYCWIIDPKRKFAWEYFPNDFEPRKVADLLLAGSIELKLEDVFFRV